MIGLYSILWRHRGFPSNLEKLHFNVTDIHERPLMAMNLSTWYTSFQNVKKKAPDGQCRSSIFHLILPNIKWAALHMTILCSRLSPFWVINQSTAYWWCVKWFISANNWKWDSLHPGPVWVNTAGDMDVPTRCLAYLALLMTIVSLIYSAPSSTSVNENTSADENVNVDENHSVDEIIAKQEEKNNFGKKIILGFSWPDNLTWDKQLQL